MGPRSDEPQVVPLAYGGDRDTRLLLETGQNLLWIMLWEKCFSRPGEVPRIVQKVIELLIHFFKK